MEKVFASRYGHLHNYFTKKKVQWKFHFSMKILIHLSMIARNSKKIPNIHILFINFTDKEQ